MRTIHASHAASHAPLSNVTTGSRSADGIERWLPVDGFPGYEVSNHGQVRGLPRTIDTVRGPRTVRGCVLSQWTTPKGHKSVSLRGTRGQLTRLVHSLVLTAFVGPRPDGYECCHSDGDPANNHVWNLRWDTSSENNFDTVRHGRHHNAIKTHCRRNHPLAGDNLVVGMLARGVRRCLACNRAAPEAWRRTRRGQAVDFQVIADTYYAAIVGTDTEVAA